MNVVFLSNFFNHHQKPFSDAMFARLGDAYSFIETKPIPQERRQLGWGEHTLPPYVISFEEHRRNPRQITKILDAADVVIGGSAPIRLLRSRIKKNKLTFVYAERPLKMGDSWWRYPDRFLRWHYRYPQKENVYLLCASAYTAGDYQKYGMFRGKAFQWGYFPETKRYTEMPAKDHKKLLWCGRFLDLKHPEHAVEVARRLSEQGYDFSLDLIGQGPEEDALRKMVQQYGLENQVHFLGSMPPEQVRRHMEGAGIYLFTSNRQEGWGAVLNEAMNSACGVVAGHEIGSVPFLLNDGENGLVYPSENVDLLYEKVRFLLEHPQEQIRLGLQAYKTITETWNAENAAENFLHLAQRLLGKDTWDKENGKNAPCGWIKE